MIYIIVLLAAILPAAFYIFYIAAFDHHKPEPIGALILSAVLGGLAALAIYWIGLPDNLGIMQIEQAHNLEDSFLPGFCKLALPAEITKWMLLFIFLSLNKYYDEHIDGVVYSVCLAMGYAGVWGGLLIYNSAYLPLDALIEKGVLIALVFVFLHFTIGTMMGYFFAIASRNKIRNYAIALLLPIFIDGLLCSIVLMIGNNWAYYFFIGIALAILAAITYTQIFRLLKMDGIIMDKS